VPLTESNHSLGNRKEYEMITDTRIEGQAALQGRVAQNEGPALDRAGAVAATLVVALLIGETIAYLTTSAPSLADASGWFRLFQTNRLIGLIDFGVLELFAMVLYVPMFLALYIRLRRVSPTWTGVAGLLALAGIAANFGSNPLFPLLTLSDAYASAASEAARVQLVAVGRAILAPAALGGLGGSVEGGFPLAVGGLIFSAVMVRGKLLGGGAAYAGLLANVVALAMYVRGAAAPTVDGSPFFGPFLLLSVIWYALIARALFRLH
jgi:hypothetical protein